MAAKYKYAMTVKKQLSYSIKFEFATVEKVVIFKKNIRRISFFIVCFLGYLVQENNF